MIAFHNATLLAITKLRTRKVRTSITIFVSGLLFASLVAALLIFTGSVRSIETFNKNGLGSRYLISATPDSSSSGQVFTNADVIKRAQDLFAQSVAEKKNLAKQLGLTYDPVTDMSPTIDFNNPGIGPKSVLNPTSKASEQAMSEYAATHPSPSLPQLQSVSRPYHPKGLYTQTTVTFGAGSLATMQGGVEDFSADPTKQQNRTDLLMSNSLAFMPDTLTDSFKLTGKTVEKASQTYPDAVPIVVPYSVATQLLGLNKQPADATSAQRLSRIAYLYEHAGSATLTACYRNEASAEQILTAINTNAEITKNAGNKKYVKPSLIYGLPDTASCGPAQIISDTRTKSEKKTAANQLIFDEHFGKVVTPDQLKITFRVVGIVPDMKNAPSNSASGILEDLVGSSLQGYIAIPQSLYDKLPSKARYDQILRSDANNPLIFSPNTYYAEFSNATDARTFLTSKSCTTRSDGTCASSDKPFQLSAFGSNSIALKDVEKKFNHLFKWAALVVCALGIIIMAGTIGRIVADGRKETAVFRATGATRLDIASIYGMYTLLLSIIVALISVGLGTLIALGAHMYLTKSLTADAQLAFGGMDTTQQFVLFGFTLKVWAVAVAAVLTGLLGMIIPLVLNVRRSPINDMRSE